MANVTTIYACTADGLAVINKPGTLGEWLPPRRVLSGSPATSVWAEPGPPVRVLAVQGGSLLLTESGGRNWDAVETEEPVLRLFPGTHERHIYAALNGGALLRSEDGGSSWQSLPAAPGDVQSLIEARDLGSFIVAGSELYSGDIGSGTWRQERAGVTALAMDESTNTLYAAGESGLLKRSAGARGWEAIAGSPAGARVLLVIPGAVGKPATLAAGTGEGLWLSPDGGETWHQSEVRDAVSAAARDPERRDRVYVATEAGVILESGNRGQQWAPVNHAPLPAILSFFVLRI
ncbi:MAG TPA: hypothetical protein VM409_02625 [Chloroflexia bacterium]|nr:hypothetical protein [Chloroflexia bacterium]